MNIKSITIAIIAATAITAPAMANQSLFDQIDAIGNGGAMGYMMNNSRQNNQNNMRAFCSRQGLDYIGTGTECYNSGGGYVPQSSHNGNYVR